MPFSRTWVLSLWSAISKEGRNLAGRLFAPSRKNTSSHEDRRKSTFCQWALEPFPSFLLLLPFPKAAVTMNLEHCFWCPWEREERDTAYKPRQQWRVLSNVHILLGWKSKTHCPGREVVSKVVTCPLESLPLPVLQGQLWRDTGEAAPSGKAPLRNLFLNLFQVWGLRFTIGYKQPQFFVCSGPPVSLRKQSCEARLSFCWFAFGQHN